MVAPLTKTAEARLRKPQTRGAFRPIDAARRQLGLVQVSDGSGQAALSWLVDLDTKRVEDARPASLPSARPGAIRSPMPSPSSRAG